MRPQHSDPQQPHRRARAPYNFVPLPQELVALREGELPLLRDRYDGLTGWFDCLLETCSPTYIRGMVTLDEHGQIEQERKQIEEMDPGDQRDARLQALNQKRAHFYTVAPEAERASQESLAIPGSTLHGMLRTLVEIIGHGKFGPVNPTPVTFRAVAVSADDPLANPYRGMLGRMASNVRAGYLERTGSGEWQIAPAQHPRDYRWPEQSHYLKVKDSSIRAEDARALEQSGFRRFNDVKNYKPWFGGVTFHAETRRGKRGPYVSVIRVISETSGHPRDGMYQGVLMCTGNMAEANAPSSPRKNYGLVLPKKEGAAPVEISREVIRHYRDSLTPFQKDDLKKNAQNGAWDGGDMGCLKSGAPVFYVVDGQGKAAWIGHTPNFRIPATTPEGRPATPADLIPEELRPNSPQHDLAEAIFGWAPQRREGSSEVSRGSMSGRVSVTDARFAGASGDLWYREGPIIPRVLSGPKVTTFQHYLVQDRGLGHDPDKKGTLAHYGNAGAQTTELRGYKLYWHQGSNPPVQPELDNEPGESQKTYFRPINPGVRFTFRVYFENLREHELGALAWALHLPGDNGKTYRHKIGMGKPLGMGSVAIASTLRLTDRQLRYSRLFEEGKWYQGDDSADARAYIEGFETFMLDRLRQRRMDGGAQRLREIERIRHLLAMLEWHGDDAEWLDATRYLEIEHESNGNEYRDRCVLPTPLGVLGRTRSPDQPASASPPRRPDSVTPRPARQRNTYSSQPRPQPGLPRSERAGGPERQTTNWLEQLGQQVTGVLEADVPEQGRWRARLPDGKTGRIRRRRRDGMQPGQQVQLIIRGILPDGELEFDWAS